ncbi:DNA topoisomerase IB [Cryobacterium sp. BB307]|uniref:DNA topoisomerase IB n=1 Tax=Cryobacterium sp. BB307 TaxID=2716317 RepID=UPI0014465C4F
MARLRRVDPAAPGWRRVRAGRGFRYLDESGAPLPEEELERILALAIPPAWKDVWISPWPNGHIQAVGTDAAGRRQYLYHEQWRRKQDELKFDRALELAARLPGARRAVTIALRGDDLTRERALAAAFRILDTAALRVGGEQYAQDNGSHGLSTLLCRHVTISGDTIEFCFPGKSGQEWFSAVTDAELARAVRAMKRRSGRLLGWRDDDGWHPLTAADINDAVRSLVGPDFTSKDFRTLSGTIAAARSLAGTLPKTRSARDKAVAAAMRDAAEALGNTPAIARKSYVDPRVIDRFHDGEVISRAGAGETALRDLLEDR